MSDTYCIKCQAHTGNLNPYLEESKDGKRGVRRFIKSTCTVCGGRKAKPAGREVADQHGGSFRPPVM